MSRKAIQRLAVAAATAIALVTGFSALSGPQPDTGWERHAASGTQADGPETGWEAAPISVLKTGWE